MSRSSFIVLLATLLAASAIADVKSVFEGARPSVVVLTTFDRVGSELAQGTGFVVSDGLVVTNHHVVDGAARVEASSIGSKQLSALQLVAEDPTQDLAILRFSSHALRPLPLAPRAAAIGDALVVVGSPMGLADTLSEGIVSALRPDGVEGQGAIRSPLIQISAPISHGSSGSPVLNSDGQVIGVAVSQYGRGQNLNFAVPVASVERLLEVARSGKTLKSYSSSRRLLLQNLSISIFIFAVVGLVFWRIARPTPPNNALQRTRFARR